MVYGKMPLMKAESHPEVFTCWKEIASYLGKGVRTVQRWEREMGLPVRRPEGTENPNKILAIRSEVDEWRASRWTRRHAGTVPTTHEPDSDLLSFRHQVERLRELCFQHQRVGYDFLTAQIELATTFIAIASSAQDSRRRAYNISIAVKAYQNVIRLRASLRFQPAQAEELRIKLAFLEAAMARLNASSSTNNLQEAIMNLEYLMTVTDGPILKKTYAAKLNDYREQLNRSAAAS